MSVFAELTGKLTKDRAKIKLIKGMIGPNNYEDFKDQTLRDGRALYNGLQLYGIVKGKPWSALHETHQLRWGGIASKIVSFSQEDDCATRSKKRAEKEGDKYGPVVDLIKGLVGSHAAPAEDAPAPMAISSEELHDLLAKAREEAPAEAPAAE